MKQKYCYQVKQKFQDLENRVNDIINEGKLNSQKNYSKKIKKK